MYFSIDIHSPGSHSTGLHGNGFSKDFRERLVVITHNKIKIFAPIFLLTDVPTIFSSSADNFKYLHCVPPIGVNLHVNKHETNNFLLLVKHKVQLT